MQERQREGEKLRDQGIERILLSHPDFVAIMQAEVMKILLQKGEVSAIDARHRAVTLGIKPVHPNAWGAVFRDPRLEFVRYEKSTIASAHSRAIVVWRLTDKEKN